MINVVKGFPVQSTVIVSDKSRHLAEWQSRFMLTVIFFILILPCGLIFRLVRAVRNLNRPEATSYFHDLQNSEP